MRKKNITKMRAGRRGAIWVAALTACGAVPLPALQAAIDPAAARRVVPLSQSSFASEPVLTVQWHLAQDATVPPVKREKPTTPDAAPAAEKPVPTAKPEPGKPDASKSDAGKSGAFGQLSPPPPGYDGVLGKIRDWLSNANREFQNVIIKGLSTKPGGEDEIAKKLEEQKQDDAKKREADAKAADAKAADDKRNAEAKRADESKRAADAKKADDAKRLAEAAAKRRLAEQQAEDKRKADEAKREADRKAAANVATPPVPPPDTTALDEARQREERARLEQAAKEASDRVAQMRREEDERAARDKAREPKPRRVELRPEPIERPDDAPRPTPRRLVDGGPPYDGLALYEARRRVPRYGEDYSYRPEPVYRPRGVVRGYVRGYRAYAHSGGRCHAAGQRARHGRRYVVARGDSLWKISRKHYRQGRTYHRIYSANRRIIRDPDLIYPCQRFVVPRKHKRRRH